MDCYKNRINKKQQQDIQEFIDSQTSDDSWLFLCAFRRFLEKQCKTELPQINNTPLVDYLEYVEDMKSEIVSAFNKDKDIMLSQAGNAYKYAAIAYQQQLQ
eukprot:TRINITY_DN12160_c0_g1_i1.p1 TRINITY_DN12160_c0_g1~~TRINITY_DN12160_c0_g1_i1.p1  ORF type:complete len:101 (-),score=16.25 TRINITY_DN12160_c0_g1_i1:189-491(-)